ncbi:hypothetical protein FOZ61_001698 [Perkinsus olseni]|uniref:Uncharacterized protein n=1 Tax=Perkinsus olseni TaxID=32597 RepID=A0A7J6KP63_PEROL|nr:hypothetical protein FOZ61_001698 [Perkinsus olseni]
MVGDIWSHIRELTALSSELRGAEGGRFSMREDAFRAIKNHEKVLVIVQAADGGSRVRGIADHFAAVARDQAVLRSLYDPATSKGYKTAGTYWRNYLETVGWLIGMGYMTEHKSFFLRLFNRAFTSQDQPLGPRRVLTISAGNTQRRARKSGKRHGGRRREFLSEKRKVTCKVDDEDTKVLGTRLR